MRRLVILLITIVVLGLPSADLFAKSGSSGSHRSSGASASGTGSKSLHTTAKSYSKNHIIKGNYNPNTGKRATKITKK
jgi:hypothetical protein